ncbi:hypothetical protein [Catalinimonas alkaloidigena]|uniref:hypothetical protein n=1 Tax=Catalinimonas alkaloidigena TaxID=1075417 RepID=UPI000B7F0AC6|nr:hypothetical protein [Catalinimonas alkaloidigena]
MPFRLTFRKTGRKIKNAITKRIEELGHRLTNRNYGVDAFMEDRKKLRSYLLRSSDPSWMSHRRSDHPTPISSEEKEQSAQRCKRLFEIEQEINRLKLIKTHLDDDQLFELPYEDLTAYGFDSTLQNS